VATPLLTFEVSFSPNPPSVTPAFLLMQVHTVEANIDSKLVDAHGHALPPFIVMERGEPLDVWAARAKPDRPQAFVVLIPPATKVAMIPDVCTYRSLTLPVHVLLS
jgi:hypothetical protein